MTGPTVQKGYESHYVAFFSPPQAPEELSRGAQAKPTRVHFSLGLLKPDNIGPRVAAG